MLFLIFISLVCGGIGYWIATRYKLDVSAGFSLGCAFGILFNGGLHYGFREYDASMKVLLIIFATLFCLAFLVILDRKTSVAWMKLAALTLLVSSISHNAILARFDYDKVQLALSHAVEDPAGSFRDLVQSVQTRLTPDDTQQHERISDQ